ncbi:DUF2783 domain-containing protein [Paraburkholderia acidiphila]|uniref:DUF2783 domain-containing protein n=1 Tax=Paraburkholderia acidiphila TaxID=2571747 RepID=A0A7Z2G8A5_9BURK|nr:DUF2783 domain-containing protein [Paraburkholderia acidiphila]QGZ56909.1 DUF2783 domain-containing protein [Paraburkholderia acidiphila]
MSELNEAARDRVYTRCANAVTAAGGKAEALFLARLVLLLFERVGDEHVCIQAIDAASHDLPEPSLSAARDVGQSPIA